MSKYATRSNVKQKAAYKATKAPFGAALEAEGVPGQLVFFFQAEDGIRDIAM
jgi:hypothetical protein